jgi:hypothetical protein
MNDPLFKGHGRRLGHGFWLRALGAQTAALSLGWASGGCGSSDANAAPKVAQAGRSETVEHEACDGSKVESLDTNNDGKPDIRRFYDGAGRERCREVDLDRDGRPDLYEYFDERGGLRRREYCYDDTGAVNAIEVYETGKLVQREYDIGGRHRIDTWDWFDPNAPVDSKTGRPLHPMRRERDTKGDGAVDQWWTWNGDQLTIAVDRNGDGKPDPEATVVFGGDGGLAPGPMSGPAATPTAPSAASGDAGSAAPDAPTRTSSTTAGGKP